MRDSKALGDVSFAGLVKDLYASLARDFSDNAECWEARANHSLAEAIAARVDEQETQQKQLEKDEEGEQPNKKKRKRAQKQASQSESARTPVETAALAVLEEGVQSLDTKDMWLTYARFVAKRVRAHCALMHAQESSAAAVGFLVARLQDVCGRAAQRGAADEHLFVLWATTALQVNDPSEAERVARMGVAQPQCSGSQQLWRLLLHVQTKRYAFGSSAPAKRGGKRRRGSVASDSSSSSGGDLSSLLAAYDEALAALDAGEAAAIWMDLIGLHVSHAASMQAQEQAQGKEQGQGSDDDSDSDSEEENSSNSSSSARVDVHACFKRAIAAMRAASLREQEDEFKSMYLAWAVSLLGAAGMHVSSPIRNSQMFFFSS